MSSMIPFFKKTADDNEKDDNDVKDTRIGEMSRAASQSYDFEFYMKKRVEYFNLGQLMQSNSHVHLIHDLHRLYFDLINLPVSEQVKEEYAERYDKITKMLSQNADKMSREQQRVFNVAFHPQPPHPAIVLNNYAPRQQQQEQQKKKS